MGATHQVKVSGMETLLLLTGSSNDTILQQVTDTDDEFWLRAGNDRVYGGGGDDIMNGEDGNDFLDGGTGADTMNGGDGSDTYVIDNTGDIVIETSATASSGGMDLIQASISYNLTDTDSAGANGGNVENLRLMGTTAINASGNALNNVLYANVVNNILNGGLGTDTVSYSVGTNQGVTVSLANTTAQVTVGSGSDTLLNIENLTGSNYNDKLTGNNGNNVLDGGLGNDILAGGLGNDTYVINVATDIVTELAGQGTDLIKTAVQL